jgi:3-hydroxyisobutyrate dehydrogenase-like beta-hydroxyacid dehydrogenase
LKIAEGDEMADAGGRRIGVIGTGRMGGPMAGRLLDAGHSLVVFDTNEAAVGPLGSRSRQPG